MFIFIWSFPGCGHQQGAEPAEAPRREERDPGERGQEGGAGHRADLPRVRGLRGGRDQGPRQPPRLEGGHDLEVLLRQVSPVRRQVRRKIFHHKNISNQQKIFYN